MPKKLIVVLVVFLLLIGAATFFLFYQNKLGLFSNLTGNQPGGSTQTEKAAAIEKQGDIYIVRGKMEEPFKFSEDKTYLVGSFIIDGDPNQTPIRVNVSSDQEGNIAIGAYTQTYAGVPSVTYKPIAEVKDVIKKGDLVEFRLNSNIKSYTNREANKHEIAIFDALNELLNGSWGGISTPNFSIFSQSIGTMNK